MDEKEREGETNKQTRYLYSVLSPWESPGRYLSSASKENANQNVACLISLQNGGNSLKGGFWLRNPVISCSEDFSRTEVNCLLYVGRKAGHYRFISHLKVFERSSFTPCHDANENSFYKSHLCVADAVWLWSDAII